MKTVYDLHRFWTSMSTIFGFTFHMGRMTEVLTPDISLPSTYEGQIKELEIGENNDVMMTIQHQWRNQLDKWGRGHIHIFVFCTINFF